MVENALRGVLRDALRVVETQGGLPGEHHFYITFDTTRSGVVMPDRLRAQHPQDMTIVLQNQFWDLQVFEEALEVTLSFNRKRERLRVPFAAVTAFADPHASFGLQFQTEMTMDGDGEDMDEDVPADWDMLVGGGEGNEDHGADTRPGADSGEDGAKVIALDAFRKKQ
nr:ClpXP protease specificity-enhancing factor SspB [Roseospira visakhapatnamensis]